MSLASDQGGGMPDDQQISQSVDNVIADTPDNQAAQPDSSQSGYSLGSNPTDNNSSSDASLSDEPIIKKDPVLQPTAPTSDDTSASDQPAAGDDELSQIKQQALSQLTPIISELDQQPEEKFRTLMMLVQASDDRTLISAAFEAANNIEDKKAKAEALLNIVNEINYFSSSSSSEQPEQPSL